MSTIQEESSEVDSNEVRDFYNLHSTITMTSPEVHQEEFRRFDNDRSQRSCKHRRIGSEVLNELRSGSSPKDIAIKFSIAFPTVFLWRKNDIIHRNSRGESPDHIANSYHMKLSRVEKIIEGAMYFNDKD